MTQKPNALELNTPMLFVRAAQLVRNRTDTSEAGNGVKPHRAPQAPVFLRKCLLGRARTGLFMGARVPVRALDGARRAGYDVIVC